MILFKACPRCQTGDLSLAEDMYGKYIQCFQCGHVIYPKADEAVSAVSKVAAKKVAAKTAVKERIAA